MKKKSTVIILAVLFAVVLIVVAAVFPKLSDAYNDTQTTAAENSAPDTSAAEVFRATDFTVYDKDGKPVKLSDFVGKPTVVNFWATWCTYCVQELPDFQNYYNQYGDRVNFLFVDLNDGFSETEEKAQQFMTENGFDLPVYFDTDASASDAYFIQSIPMTLFINSDGSLYQKHIGLISDGVLGQYLEALCQ